MSTDSRAPLAAFGIILASMAAVAEGSRIRGITRAPGDPWAATLVAAPAEAYQAGSLTVASSSKLALRWSPLPTAAGGYRITLRREGGGAPDRIIETDAATSSTTISGLDAQTTYEASIEACLHEGCNVRISGAGTASATTAAEYWQIRGTGRTFATAHRLIADGNTKPFALLRGADAPPAIAGTAQLYYDPMIANEKGVKIGSAASEISSTADSVSSFLPVSGYGFLRSDAQGRMGAGPATMQPVALHEALGGNVRLFWEAETDGPGTGAVFSADSVDGWTGRDFHSGVETICREADLAPGGPCAATLLVGGELHGNPEVRSARQLKVGVPLLDDWRWNGAPGTFMVVTLHLARTRCSTTFFNMGHAVWDGARWKLAYGDDGCPRLLPGIQAPMPVHLGGVRWKLYFNHNANTGGGTADKPVKVLFADGASTGDPATVDFDDWENVTRARTVNFLWPDGTLLTPAESSMLDDYQVWMPTGDPSFQVIYSNMSCPANACGPPFIGMAVLLNP